MIQFAFLLAFTIVMTKAQNPTDKPPPAQYVKCTHEGYTVVEGKFGNEKHDLCLKTFDLGNLALASENSAILLDPDATETKDVLHGFPLTEVTMAFGYPIRDPHTGSAEGYIGDDNFFYGVLHLGNRTLHADPYGRDSPNRTYGAFDHDRNLLYKVMTQNNETLAENESEYEETVDENFDDLLRTKRHHFHDQNVSRYSPYFSYQIEERERNPGIARARICDLLLLADWEFYINDGNSSLNQVVRRMVHAVAQADIIFRNTDFDEDGVPDNIGFAVKYIIVLTSNETNRRVFGDFLSEKTVLGREYLMKFARLRRLSEVCLGIAFSGHAFINRTLGLSFTSVGGGMGGAAGGLCDRRAYGRSFNTLALAHATQDGSDRVPERIAARTLTHELGHSFGAHHDDNFPNPECRGYLMGSQAENKQHFQFSICSKRLIAATLKGMSYCLTDENRSYCGNGIVEEGEACDCGLPSSCTHRDPCCTPRAGGALVHEEGTLHVEGCSVAPSAQCHPSQGLCCTNHCQYADLTASGIDCTGLDQECNCIGCRCGLQGRCLPDGSCHAAECTLLGLRECQCTKKGPGGKVSEANMCGICCVIRGKHGEKCVGAELAARKQLLRGWDLPDEWPHEDYQGPNVTIEVCREVGQPCQSVPLRAWYAGDRCVSMGMVGMCSIWGQCKPRARIPRSNVYPKAMTMHLTEMNSSSSVRPATWINFLVFIAIYVVKRICK